MNCFGYYRFGFQGQESDNEVKGKGNSVNYKYRMHCLSREERIGNPRVGRFFSVDPLTAKYPHYTPYSFSGNKLIAWAELEGKEEILVIREQVNADEYRLTYIWDVTAENRGEQGLIQYYDASTGTLGIMRRTTLEERKNTIIRNYLSIPLIPRTEKSTVNSYITESMGIKRTNKDGNLVPYLQTHRNVTGANIGETRKIFTDNILISGVTSILYTMPIFRASTDDEKRSMTQPSASMRDNLDALASLYLSGDAIDIKVQITTNNPSTMANIVESNTMRQNAIVDYLVAQGVDRSSIQTLPFLYNQPTWDAQVTYDKAKPVTE